MGSNVKKGVSGFRSFLDRQSHNYRMLLVRGGGNNFLYNLTGNYSSIYTKELGANDVTIGMLSSISAFVSMIISLPAGWVSDNYNLRKVLGVGMVMQILMVALYAFAGGWEWILVAMVLNPFTMALMFRSQRVMISNGLKDEDRATGMGLEHTLPQVIGLIAPIPAAFLIERFGGLSIEGIRPLFYIRLVGMIILYTFVYLKLTNVIPKPRASKINFLQDLKDVLKDREGLKAMILVGALGPLVWSTMDPFVALYAKERIGADALTLGLMSTCATASSILFSVPLNRLADSKGRKYAFVISRPALWVAMVIMVLAPSPVWLLVAWFLRGIATSSSAYGTLMVELVPPEHRGRWLGITNVFSAMVRIAAPILGGFMYQSNFPVLIFVIPLVVDLCLRTPILAWKVPETLRRTHVLTT